jgi:hypothetical protein
LWEGRKFLGELFSILYFMIFFKKQKVAKTDADILSFTSAYFHGNIRAQLGRIITAKDVERKRKEVTSHVF